tara:strand:+ start:1096 stop:1347 length:252 start_codon:yes stop_codon:yes gene_type:complete
MDKPIQAYRVLEDVQSGESFAEIRTLDDGSQKQMLLNMSPENVIMVELNWYDTPEGSILDTESIREQFDEALKAAKKLFEVTS